MCPLKNIVLLCLSQEEMISFWFYIFLREVMVRPLQSVIIRAWNLMRATQASVLTPGKCLELNVTILLILCLQYVYCMVFECIEYLEVLYLPKTVAHCTNYRIPLDSPFPK